MSVSLFAEEATVVFEANGHTKKVTVDLPHTFSCNYSNGNGELDGIIKELYALPSGSSCTSETPVRTGNTMVTAGKDGYNQFIAVEDVFDGKAIVSGKYYKSTGELGYDVIDYNITVSIWNGSAVEFNVPGSWEGNATTVTAADFPDFTPIPQAKAQTLTVSASGIVYVIYDVTGNGDVKCAVYNDGAYIGEETYTNNRATIYLLTASGSVYYTVPGKPVAPATPVISGDKYFVESNTVTITCASKGAVIYYTLNGMDPIDNRNSIVYEDPFEITGNKTTVKAASYNGEQWSDVVEMEFKQGEMVVFAANGRRKGVVVPLPYTFSCAIGGYGELDYIIQELYELPDGGDCENATPVAKGNAAVTAGKNWSYQYITVSSVFDGVATVSGVYRKKIDEVYSEPCDYSLTIGFRGEIQNSIVWDSADLATIQLTSNGSKTISGITVTTNLSASWTSKGDLVDCNKFSVRSGGTITFSAPVGHKIVAIEINANTVSGEPNTPWVLGDQKFTWNGVPSNSVVLQPATAANVQAIDITSVIYTIEKGINLVDNDDNSSIISANNGACVDVTLQGRTLYKDGDWNTLCLPFDVTIAGSVLEGADVRALDISDTGYDHATGLDGNTLYLNFTAEGTVTEIKAGIPYIIKWGTPDSHPDTNLTNPVFTGVTIDNSAEAIARMTQTFTGGAFKGTYEWQEYTAENQSILFLGADNQLFWPKPSGGTKPSIGACRAYFELTTGVSAREFVLNFGEETTSLPQPLQREGSQAGAWFDLSGRKLDGKPTKKGVYIHEGRKVVIK